MRVCVRLAVLAGLLVAVAMGLIALRTDVHQAGNRLHDLFRAKRRLGRQCCRLELHVARLRSQDRLQGQAAHLCQGEADGDSPDTGPYGADLASSSTGNVSPRSTDPSRAGQNGSAGGARPVVESAPSGPP